MDYSEYQHLTFERKPHGVVLVTINRPDVLNATNDRLHWELTQVWLTLDADDGARVAVVTGAGRAFSAGGDMAWFPELRSVEAGHALRREAKQMIWDLLDVEVPIVCGLNGSAAGLAASIALLCDVVVMSSEAKIVDPHVLVGLVAGDGGAAVWPLLLGPLAAKRHLMLGEPLTAVEAHRLGVAAEVCEPADVAQRARAWADRLAAGAPLAVQGTKLAVNAQLKRALLDSFDYSTALEMPCFFSADHAEAVQAFVDKRTPRFEGR
jgi:enoyl-CoA hydratase